MKVLKGIPGKFQLSRVTSPYGEAHRMLTIDITPEENDDWDRKHYLNGVIFEFCDAKTPGCCEIHMPDLKRRIRETKLPFKTPLELTRFLDAVIDGNYKELSLSFAEIPPTSLAIDSPV